ncbi:MAG TPA: peptidase S41, partial [Oxalicibacterium sp.]|nr:peptidase S41 [Oxalicibacterium sp.]
ETKDGDDFNGFRLREADLQKHLTNDKDKGAEVHAEPDTPEEEQRLLALEKKHKPLEFGSADDFQLQQAMNHLKGLPVVLSKTKTVETKKEPSINDPKHEDKPESKKPADKKPADKKKPQQNN